MSPGTAVTNSPASMIAYQNDLLRTGKYQNLGRIKIISIAPNEGCPVNQGDPLMSKFGRMMQFRNDTLPLAWTFDHSMLLVPGRLSRASDNLVELPDLPDPEWVPGPYTEEEISGRQVRDSLGVMRSIPVPRPIEKDTPRMVPQSLRDRAEGFLEGTNFYAYSPVLSVGFQPEKDSRLVGTYWGVNCKYNPADRSHPTLLIDAKTGEVHFYGGVYEVVTAVGEN